MNPDLTGHVRGKCLPLRDGGWLCAEGCDCAACLDALAWLMATDGGER